MMGQKLVWVLMAITLPSCFYQYEERIKIDGSSTLFPLTEAVAEDYRRVDPNTKITIGVSGTGGGFKKLARNEVDIINASRSITSEEEILCRENGIEYIELPVSYDGIVIVVHPDNDFVDYLSISELKKIWEPDAQGKIKYWDQVRAGWPHKPIQLFGAGTSSGSFDYFTKAITGEAKASRGDYTASEDDNVLVQGVSGAKGALGYFGIAYYLENKEKLKAIPIDDEISTNGVKYIFPSDSTIRNGQYFPLARVEFLYVNKNALQKKVLIDFVNFYLNNCASLEAEINGVALSAGTYVEVQKRFEKKITGTLFATRSLVGANLEKLLKSENDQNN